MNGEITFQSTSSELILCSDEQDLPDILKIPREILQSILFYVDDPNVSLVCRPFFLNNVVVLNKHNTTFEKIINLFEDIFKSESSY